MATVLLNWFYKRWPHPAARQRAGAADTGHRNGAGVLDPLEKFAAERLVRREPPEDEVKRAYKAYAEHLEAGTWEQGIEMLQDLISRYPHIVRFQILAARMLEAAQRHDEAAMAWRGIQGRFPDSDEAFLLSLSSIRKHQGQVAAEREISQHFAGVLQNYHDRLLQARAWEVVGDGEKADACFSALIELHGEHQEIYVRCVAFHVGRGDYLKAWEIARRGCLRLGKNAKTLVKRYAELTSDLEFLRRIGGEQRLHATRASNMVLERLLRDISRRRAEFVDTQPPSYLGSVLMINSSLGAGGAERQFVNTAIAMQRAARSGQSIAGYDVLGPVEVCCRSLTKRKGADFFVPVLKREGIAVSVYTDFPRWGGSEERSILAEYKAYLKFLPSVMVEAVLRLADVMRASSPSVVHIWQDGSIFATVLAALMADVPRIVLSVRTLPPIDRPDRYKPEYDVLYTELLKMPGVVLNANSRYAAKRYADWLGVDEQKIPVVYNGLEPFSRVGGPVSQAMFDEFHNRTSDAVLTIGTVMRVDKNKRPFLWLDAAARFLHRHPRTRFIVVGDGPLRREAEEYAHRLGLSGRILFTGLSNEVGYWLSKLDAFVLLSRFEGLPNVLIEAQFAGVPIVTTLAGGAGEALVPGKTGVVIPNDRLQVEDVCRALEQVCAMRSADPTISSRAAEFAVGTFSIQQMVSSTVCSYLGGWRCPAQIGTKRYGNESYDTGTGHW